MTKAHLEQQRIPKGEHGSLDWLRRRWRNSEGLCIVGASEVPTIMLASEYEQPVDLAIRKVQQPVVTPPNDAMMRGNLLESACIAYASMQLGVELRTPECMYLYDRVICTLDAEAHDADRHYLVECKTSNRWSLSDEVPASWWWQAQAQMYVMAATEVAFSVLDKGMRFGMFTVERNDDAIGTMVAEVERFCNAIDDGRMPDSTLTMQQVAALYPKPEGVVELDAQVLHDIEEWQAIKDALKQLEADEQRVKDKLANALRGAEFGTVNGARVLSYKSQTTRRIDTKGLAAAHPKVAEAFTTDSTFRVLRATK